MRRDRIKSVGRGGRRRILRWLRNAAVISSCLWLACLFAGWSLRRIAIGQIVEMTDSKVRTASVDIDFGGSVSIEKLIIKPHREQGHDETILKAEKVYARFGIGSLFLLNPRLKEIKVHDFVFNALYDMDTGRWNIAGLKFEVPGNGGCGKMPLIHLEEGVLRYGKVLKGQVRTVAAIPVDARFGPAEEHRDGYSFNIRTGTMAGGFGKSNLSGRWRPGHVTITGGISSAAIREFERTFEINVMAAELDYDRHGNYSLQLRAKDLLSTHRAAGDISTFEGPAFIRKFGAFTALQKFFARFDPQGRFNMDIEEMSGNLQRLGESTLRGRIQCQDISICDRRFPYLIEHIEGSLDFTEKGVELQNLRGEHGDVKVDFNGWCRRFESGWRYDIKVASDNMALDNDLYDALNVKQKKFWSTYSPSGLARIDYHLSRHPQTNKEITLAVELLNAEAAYQGFPYPLKNLTGKLFFDRDTIKVADIVSQFEGSRISIDGSVTDCNTNQPLYDISIAARDIPLDSTLGASLSDTKRDFYNGLNLSGVADAQIKVLKCKGKPGPADFTAKISVKKAFLKPDEFPLAISDVSSEVTVTRDLLHVHNLTGVCGEGAVSLSGRIWPGEKEKGQEPRYRLVLRGEKTQLDDDLFCLLPESVREVVTELQPQGKINYSVDFGRTGAVNRPEYRITIDCLGNSFNFEPLSHVMRNVSGSLVITTESTQPENAAGAGRNGTTADTTTVGVTGLLFQTDNEHSESRFDLDLERIRIFDAEGGEKYIDFAGVAKFKGCNLDILPAVTELDGTLRIEGLYRSGEGFRKGRAILSANSLRIRGKYLSGVQGALVYSAGRKSWLSNDLTADCYDGKLAGKFELKEFGSGGTSAEYLLQVGLDAVDLKKFLSDAETSQAQHNGETTGMMSGSLSVGGTVGEGSSRIGRCRLTVTDMQLGRLSPPAKLLCVLKLTEPGDFAFDQMVVDSYIQGNGLFFEHLDLSGEALAFTGSGWMNLQNQNVDLVLFARGERLAAAEPSVFQSLTEGVSQALVQMELSGNYNDPKVTTTTLPVIRESLGIFGVKRATQNR